MSVKYKHLVNILKEEIITYRKKGIEKLPTEQDLCENFMVSRQTVRTALAHLEKEGLIEKRRGSGSYITGLSDQEDDNTIVILISDTQEYIYPQLLFYLENALSSHGFSAQVLVTQGLPGKEREHLTALLQDPPRALLVESCSSALPNVNLSLYRMLEKAGTNIVFLGLAYPGCSGIESGMGNYAQACSSLTEFLINQGHRDIACLFRIDDLAGHECFRGMQEMLLRHEIPILEEYQKWYGRDEWISLLLRRDVRFLKRLIREIPAHCTSIICQNDLLAYYLIDELQKKGYSVPDDVMVTCFAESSLGAPNIVHIPTLRPSEKNPYQSSIDVLLKRLKGLPAYAQEIPWILHK